jgi:plasmid stabilization system protein ParE
MARFRVSAVARSDIRKILATRTRQWGPQGGRRYAALLTAAIHAVAADPKGVMTRSRSELMPGLRSFHTRHVWAKTSEQKVSSPVHLIYYYQALQPNLIEILRVLHERWTRFDTWVQRFRAILLDSIGPTSRARRACPDR